MKPGLPSIESVVQDLYGSLAEDASFLPCLQCVAGTFRSHFTCLHHEDLALGVGSIAIVGELDAAEYSRMSADYAARWAGNNPWVDRCADAMRTRGWADGDDLVAERELKASDYYKNFITRVDVRHGLGVSVHQSSHLGFAIISFNRSAAAGAFTDGEKRLVDALRPHLVNAYAISRHLRTLEQANSTFRASIDQLPVGLLVLRADGRVDDFNEEASRLLGLGLGIALHAERWLVLADPLRRAQFHAALGRLARQAHAPQPEVILVAPPGVRVGAVALHLCALPVEKGRILAFLTPVDRALQSRLATRLLQVAFDLTQAEAAVVSALRKLHDPAHVALELGLAISTVRSHLKHVFAKTGTGGQRELIRLVECLLAGVRSESPVHPGKAERTMGTNNGDGGN